MNIGETSGFPSARNDAAKAEPLGIEERVSTELAQALITASLSQPLSGVLIALAFWLSFYFQAPHFGILLWAGLMHSVQLQRALMARKFRQQSPTAQRTQAAARWISVAHVFSGTVWGLAPWLCLPSGNLPMACLITLLLLCMSSLGMVALSSHRSTLLCFNVPIFFGLASALFWQREGWYLILGVGTLLYMYSNLQYGFKLNRVLIDSLRARHEKEELAHKLAAQVEFVERASREKTRFFASASHDLRQPLHSLGLFGAAIQARLKNTPDANLATNLMVCVDALEASFSSMLDVSKLDAGVVEVSARPVSLVEVFRHLQGTYAGQAETQGLALRFNPGGKWVHADPGLLERVLGNLIHNALKFTAQGGVVVLARSVAEGISIEVWDSGQGIAASEFDQIFEEFYQIGNRERDRARGLGMGLAIVRRLADLMRAPLKFASRPGVGSVFKLRLPASSPPIVNENLMPLPVPVAQREFSGAKVLVVDDEASVRESTSAALRLYGFEVEVADGASQAQTIAARLGDQLDVLITDYRLCNGNNGIAVASSVRAILGRQLPTLLITGDTAPERVREAKSSGLHVLYKPVMISALVKALRTELSLFKAE